MRPEAADGPLLRNSSPRANRIISETVVPSIDELLPLVAEPREDLAAEYKAGSISLRPTIRRSSPRLPLPLPITAVATSSLVCGMTARSSYPYHALKDSCHSSGYGKCRDPEVCDTGVSL